MSGTPIGIVDTDVGPLLAPIDPWIWPCLVETGAWEPMVGDVIRSVLRAGDMAVNVGAHVGYFTRMMSTIVCGTGVVLAYEPAPSNRRLLELNLADKSNVSIRPSAVSDTAGWATFTFSGVNPGDHRLADEHPDAAGSMSVQVVTLDEDMGRPVDLRLILTDAQGLDLHILRGARDLIATTRPHLLIEWTPNTLDHADYPEIDRILDLGYTARLVEPGIEITRAADGDVLGQGTATMHLAPPS